MADIEVDLLIRALSEGFEKLSGDLTKLGESTKAPAEPAKKTSLSLTDLKSAIDLTKEAAQTFGQVFKTAFDFGVQGATITQTSESFDMLMGVIKPAPDLLEQLTDAAGGTIPQFKLMSMTSTLLAGAQGKLAVELANATPRLLEIARAASKLNPSLGDTAFLYQSLATGIKRASPMILDNLGLTIKIGDANEAMAEQLGKSVEALSAEEKQLALLNSALEAGDVLINQVGGNVESAVDPFMRLQTAGEELTNTMKAGLAPALADAASAATILITAKQTATEALAEHNDVVVVTSENYQAYVDEMNRAIEAGQLLLGVNGVITEKQKILTEAQYEAIKAGSELEASELSLALARSQGAITAGTISDATIEWADSSFYAKQAIDAARTSTLNAQAAMEEAEEAAKNIASAFRDVGLAAYEAEVMTTLLAVATGSMSAEEAQLKLNLLDVQQAVKEGKISMGEYFAAMLDGQITTEEYNALLGENVGVLGEQASGLDTVEQEMIAAKQATEQLSSAIEAVPKQININFEISVTGDEIPNVGGYNGAPTGPTTPTFDQKVGDIAIEKPGSGGADWRTGLSPQEIAEIGNLMGGGYGLAYAYELVTGRALGQSAGGYTPGTGGAPPFAGGNPKFNDPTAGGGKGKGNGGMPGTGDFMQAAGGGTGTQIIFNYYGPQADILDDLALAEQLLTP